MSFKSHREKMAAVAEVYELVQNLQPQVADLLAENDELNIDNQELRSLVILIRKELQEITIGRTVLLAANMNLRQKVRDIKEKAEMTLEPEDMD